MALPAGLTWEVRTTGNANNGGAYVDLIPGTSVDYSQQNGSQLSVTDGACLLASVTLTSVIGGFTAGMAGNVIQIRAGGVNFVAGFYEIVLINSANSVNLDRTPVAAGNGTGGLGEVGGALISPETFILNGVAGNLCYVKSGTYNFAADRSFVAGNTQIFGYDVARNVIPTGVNRPLFALGAFRITTHNVNLLPFTMRNISLSGSGTPMITLQRGLNTFINCKFHQTSNVGAVECIKQAVDTAYGHNIIDCEFSGTLGATHKAISAAGMFPNGNNTSWFIAFCFFHDLSYAFYNTAADKEPIFIKNIFARIAITTIFVNAASIHNGYIVLFNSFYSAGQSHISLAGQGYGLIYGNTLDSATVVSLAASATNKMWYINNNDFWNNGAVVSNVSLDFGNIGLNPLWVNPLIDDFNFGPGSPNIDQALGIRLGV
jgi:hypothetical protein